MAELTEELTRDLSKIFESAVARGLTEGAKKALKDKAFKQLEGMLAAGATPGTASALAGAAARQEIGLHAHDLLAKSLTRNSSWRSRQDAAPVPLIGGGADVPSYGSYQRSLFGLRGSVRTMAERMERYAPLGPPSLHFPNVQPDTAPVQHYTHPGLGARHAAANPRRLFETETIAGATIPLAQQVVMARTLGGGSAGASGLQLGPLPSMLPLDGSEAEDFGAAGRGPAVGNGAYRAFINKPLLSHRIRMAALRAGGAARGIGAQLGSTAGDLAAGARGLLSSAGGTLRGAGAWATEKAGGFMGAAWAGISKRLFNPTTIALTAGAALLSPLWGSMESAAGTDDQLWDAARPLMGGLLQTDTTDVATGVFTDPHIDDPHTARPVRAPNRSQISLVKRRSSTAPSGDWGDVMGGYRSKTALFADMASRGYSKRQVIEMVGSAARGASMGGMRQEMALQARIHGYVTPAISGEWLHQEAMGGFTIGAGIESSLRSWIGMPGFARKGQDMLSLESQMAASFQAGGAMSFNQDVFRAGVAGARGLGLTMGASVALQQKSSMAGLGVSTGGTGQTQEDLWRLHLLGGLDLTQGYVSPEMMLRSRRSAETAKYEDVLARAKKMGGSGDLGKLYAQDFMQVAGVPISVSTLEAAPGAPLGETGKYAPGSRGRTGAQHDAAAEEFIDTVASYDASAASGAVKTKLAEVKGLLSKLYKVIADLAGAQ